jgi:hypothetical protein
MHAAAGGTKIDAQVPDCELVFHRLSAPPGGVDRKRRAAPRRGT